MIALIERTITFFTIMLLTCMRRYPFWSASLAIHLIVIGALYYFNVTLINDDELHVKTSVQQARVNASLQKIQNLEMQKNIENLQVIKDLLEQSMDDKKSSDPANEKSRSIKLENLAAKTPQELAIDAKQLMVEIKSIQQIAKAEELAKILKIPEPQALQQVQKAELNNNSPDASKLSENELANHVAQLESQARDVLAQRQTQLNRQQNGSAVMSANKTSAQGSALSNSATKPDDALSNGGEHLAVVDKKIGEFLNGNIPLPKSTMESNGDIFQAGNGHIPALAAATTIKGSGRILGAGSEFANRFYINGWYMIGPFGGEEGASIFSNHRYPPERAIDLAAVYKGKDNRLLQWQYFTTNRYPLVPPNAEEDAVYYGYTEIKSDEERDLWAWIGADDTSILWLNDHLVYEGSDPNKGWFFEEVYNQHNSAQQNFNLTEAKVFVHFKKGSNKILFKLSNASRHTFFSLVVTR